MENNNLDDFFNKKLNNFDSSGDDWDKLGKAPFESIQPDFPKYPKTTWSAPMSVLTGVMGVALTALVVYTFYLKNEIKILEQHIITENIIKEIAPSNTSSDHSVLSKNETQSTVNSQSNEIIQNTQNKPFDNNKPSITSNSETKKINNSFTEKVEKSVKNQSKEQGKINRVEKQENPLNGINKTKESKQSQITKTSEEGAIAPNLTLSLREKNDTKKASDIQKIDNQTLSEPIVFDIENLDFLALIPAKELTMKPSSLSNLDIAYQKQLSKAPVKKSSFRSKLGSFSLGYEYGFSNMIIPYDVELQNTDNLPTKDDFNTVRSHAHGLILGYTWNPHWRVLGGIRWSEAHIRQETNLNVIYNSANEYTLLNGSIANDLVIDRYSPLTNKKIDYTLEFPTNQRLNDGEVIRIEMFEKQDIEQIQIPLALEYIFGKNKLQYFTQLGIQFNLMEIKILERDVSAKNFNQEVLNINSLPIENNRIKEQSIGIFGSVGANYELTQRWSLRASFVYQHNFDDHSKQQGRNENGNNRDFVTEQAIRLGVNYQF